MNKTTSIRPFGFGNLPLSPEELQEITGGENEAGSVNVVVIRQHDPESPFRRGVYDILDDILNRGYYVKLDPERNPVTFWISTDMPVEEVRKIEGVFDAIYGGEK